MTTVADPLSSEAPVDEKEPATSPSTWRFVPPRFVTWRALHLLNLGLAAVVLMVANRNQWFSADDWEFIVNRGPEDQSIGLFTPHNEHWSTIPILIYRVLLAIFGLTSYLPYVAVLVGLHLGLCHLLWVASVRSGAHPAIAVGLAAVFSVLGAGWENLLWAFQMGFVGAIAFGWAAVLLHDHDGPFDRRDVGGWAASVVALMFSGPALVMVGVATLTVALRRRRPLDVALTASVPVAVFAVWWLITGRNAQTLPKSEDAKWSLVDFVWRGITHAPEAIVGIPGSGALLVLGLAYWWIRHSDAARGAVAVAAASSLGMVAFFFMTGSGRVVLGVEAATAPRYVYIAAALLLPGAAYVLSRVTPPSPASIGIVLGICALAVGHNVGALHAQMREEMGREQAFKAEVLASARLLDERDPLVWQDLDAALNPDLDQIDPVWDPDLTVRALDRIAGYDWLPDGEPTHAAELTAETVFDVVLEPAGGALDAVPLAAAGIRLDPAEPSGGATCVSAVPLAAGAQIAFQSDAPSWRVRLDGSGGESFDLALSDGETNSRTREFTLRESGATDLVSTAAGRTVTLMLREMTPLRLCGVAP